MYGATDYVNLVIRGEQHTHQVLINVSCSCDRLSLPSGVCVSEWEILGTRLQYPRCIEHPLLTCGVACLYHELFYHSVKDVSIVVPLAGVYTEVLDCLRTAVNKDNRDGDQNKGERGYGDWNTPQCHSQALPSLIPRLLPSLISRLPLVSFPGSSP